MCQEIREIYNAFKEAGSQYGKNYELASIGALVNINMNAGDLVSEVIEAAEFLKSQKGLGKLEMDRYTRLMFSTMIISSIYSEEAGSSSASVTSGALATVITQQICMYVAIMAASTSVVVSSVVVVVVAFVVVTAVVAACETSLAFEVPLQALTPSTTAPARIILIIFFIHISPVI